MSQASPLTPSLDLLHRRPHRPGSSDLQRAPRKRSKVLAVTPKSARKELSSPFWDRTDSEILTSTRLTPTARGSPMLPSRNGASPKFCPFSLRSPYGSQSVQQSPSKYQGDRFIPTRSKTNVDRNNLLVVGSPYTATTPAHHNQVPTIRVLAFGSESPQERSPKENLSEMGKIQAFKVKEIKTPESILDAPGVLQDQGNNLLDWSIKNMLALALDDTVFLWDSVTQKTEILCTSPIFTWVTAVKWNREGTVLAVARSGGKIHFWNRDTGCLVLYCTAHCISSIVWNGDLVTCGNLRGQIHHIDLAGNIGDKGRYFSAHTSAVTSMTWNRSGELLASGCKDGTVKIWSGQNPAPQHVLPTQTTEITSCQWSPFLNSVLAVGTGKGEIFVWRISQTITEISNTHTNSPVTDLKWFPGTKGIFSSHENGDVNLFTYPTLKNVKRFKGHNGSVLTLSLAPDDRRFMSLGADETLRIWNITQEESIKRSPIRTPSPLSRQCLR